MSTEIISNGAVKSENDNGIAFDKKPKAIAKGMLFDGKADCYVLDNEQRIFSSNGVVRVLSDGARERGDLGRYVAHLPSRFADLAVRAKIEFTLPGGGVAVGYEAQWVVDLLRAYDDADDAGELHYTQHHVARHARRILRALAGVGILALVDEATGYQAQRAASALSFAFRAILQESTCKWDLMWPNEFVKAICQLHGEPWEGGAHPAFIASTYDKLYQLILGKEVCAELKQRNPNPHFGTNHHQWLTPEAREVVRRQIPILTAFAETCGTKDEFWARVEHRYGARSLQLSWIVPQRAVA